jgi:3-hydroxyisobutyrate dehydrogenase-like beta-hydroxyacid dehydrogenase
MNRTKIGIIGSGIVGGATGKAFVAHGYDVTFFDVMRKPLDALRNAGYKVATSIETRFYVSIALSLNLT